MSTACSPAARPSDWSTGDRRTEAKYQALLLRLQEPHLLCPVEERNGRHTLRGADPSEGVYSAVVAKNYVKLCAGVGNCHRPHHNENR